MIQDVFILGATGNVGSELIKQIYEKGDTDSSIHHNPTRVVGLASSRNFLFSPNGFSYDVSRSFANKELRSSGYKSLDEILGVVKGCYNGNGKHLVFVDVTAVKDEMKDFHLNVMENTNHGLVTANKNPLALYDRDVFNKLASRIHRYGYSCSVMAGAGAVQFLQDARDLRDKPVLIEGCFSGTLGYLCSGLEEGQTLYDVVCDAKEKGYTEPHPRDDLNGLDVARKLLILARTAGYDVDLCDIQVHPFIPEDFLHIDNVEEFLKSLHSLNGDYNKMFLDARERGNVLKYVASMKKKNNCMVPSLEVALKEVPKDSSLGSLVGTANKIAIVNEAYPENNPFIIEAPGAGLAVTAQNVRRNLLQLLEDRKFLI